MNFTRQLLNIKNPIEPVEQLTEELEYESVTAVNQLLTEGRIGNYTPPFKANGLWVDDRYGTSVLEVTRHDTAKQVAAALNAFVKPESSNKTEVKSIDEQKISEIDYSDLLNTSNFSEKKLIAIGKKDGEIEGTPVMLAKSGNQQAYFLVNSDKITAFIGFEDGHLRNVKNFTNTAGAIRALIGYLVHKKGKTLSILANEPLTPDGFKWITHLVKNPRGLVIKDQDGKDINADALSTEWENAKRTGKSGKTSITISEESEFGDKLRLNEQKREKDSILMVHNFYDISDAVAEGSLNEEAGNMIVRKLIADFNEQMSGSPYHPLDYKDVGMRSWTRGDGSRYKDPGYIYIDKDMKPQDIKKYSAQKPIEKFWQFLSTKGARKIGDVSGEFGSDPYSPAVVLGKLIFVFNGKSIAWGSTSRLKNSSVWRQKQQQGVTEDIANTRREVNLKKKIDKGVATPEQKKEYQELKAKNMGRPVPKQGVAESGILKFIKRGLQGWDKNAVGPGGEKLGDPRDIVKRAKAMDTDTAKKVRSGLDAASDHSPAGLQKRVLDRKLKGVAEDPSYKKGWELCNKDPSADPQHLFRKHGDGLDHGQFIKGFNDNAKLQGMRIHGDVRGDVDHSTLRYKEFKRDRGVSEGSEELKNLSYIGNCTDDDVIEHLFGDATNFAQLVDEHGDEFILGNLVVKYDSETDIHSFYSRTNMKEQFLIKELLQLKENSDDRLTADHLYVGSPVEITGDVEFKGSTGEILSFGQDKKFVVVNLYNGGKHSFHSSDVRELDEDDYEEEEDDEGTDFYVVFHDEDEQDTWIGKLTQEGGKWRERTHKGKPDYRWGTSYMGYLSPNDVMSWIHKDYSRGMQIDGPFDSAQEAEQFAQHNYGQIGEMVESAGKTVSKSGDFSLTCSGDTFSLHHKSKKIATLDHSDWMDLVDAVKNRTTGSFGGYSVKQKADSYTLHDSTGKEIAYMSATDMDKLAADSKEYLSLNEAQVYTDFDDWKKAVLNSYPMQAKKIKFKGKMEGEKTTISAEIPGEDRSYGVWDLDKSKGEILEGEILEGEILGESLKHAENCDYRFGGTCDCGLEQGEDYED